MIAIDLVAEELDADRLLVRVRRMHLHDVAAHPEFAARKVHVVALVKHVHELGQHRFAA